MTNYLAFSIDKTYYKILTGALKSIRLNSDSEDPTEIYILHTDLDKKDLSYINKIVENSHFHMNFIKMKPAEFRDLPKNFYFTPAVYYRLKLPDIIREAEKIVYLDADVIVRKSLNPLFKKELSGYCLAAVENPGFERHDSLGMAKGSSYFNSGVLILNAKKIREENLTKDILNYAKKFKDSLLYADQDVLNGFFENQWMALDPEWNVQTKFYYPDFSSDLYSEDQIVKALRDPAIVHFTTLSKPWHFMNNHPFKDEFIKYMRLNGHKVSYDDLTLKNFLKKIYKKNLRRRDCIDYNY